MTKGIIVCHLGAREHYAVARVLHKAGLLKALITDVWVPPESILRITPGQLGRRLRGRYHPELADANVIHFTQAALALEARQISLRKCSQWRGLQARNAWFEAASVRALASHSLLDSLGGNVVVLAYSYAARDILLAAKTGRAGAILAQIDGGETDERLVAEISQSRANRLEQPAPAEYWERWHQECSTADRIIVNSEWSQRLLIQASIDSFKIDVVPIPYEPDGDELREKRFIPDVFTSERPLKVLFLGAATLRKGILEFLGAARLLSGQPVAFTIVGNDPDGYASDHGLANVQYFSAVPRKQVTNFYVGADILVFPTHSDGFGMVQIEALAAGLPVIASRHCAALVQHGWNGLIIEDVSSSAITQAIQHVLVRPDRLAEMSRAAYSFSSNFGKAASARLLEAAKSY